MHLPALVIVLSATLHDSYSDPSGQGTPLSEYTVSYDTEDTWTSTKRAEPIDYVSFKNGDVFGLKAGDNDGEICMLASFEGRIVVTRIGQWYPLGDDAIIPINTHEASMDGRCAPLVTDKNGDVKHITANAKLEIVWAKKGGDKFRLFLLFESEHWTNPVKGTKEWVWKLSNLQIDYIPPLQNDSSSIRADMLSTHRTISPIRAPITQSFFCKHSFNVSIQGVDPSRPAIMNVQFKAHSRLQPFNVEQNGGFGNNFLCDRSRKIGMAERLKSNWTIGIGSMLTLLAIGQIVAYSVKRYMIPTRQEYTEM